MTKAERAHLDAVAGLGCILCLRQGTPGTRAEIHHIRDGQGMAQRAGHFETLPLCPYHHTGPQGYHGLGKRLFEAAYGVTERELLDQVLRLLQGG